MDEIVSISIWPSELTPSSEQPSPNRMGDSPYAGAIPFSDGPDGQKGWITVTEGIAGTSTASLTIYDLDNSFTIGRLSNISIGGIFSGIVQKVSYAPLATYRIIKLSCVNLNAFCDTNLVGAIDGKTWWTDYMSQSVYAVDPDAYLGGGTDVEILQHLFDAYWKGPGTVNLGYVRTINPSPFGTGLLPEYPLTDTPWLGNPQGLMLGQMTLRGALDAVATASGPEVIWWIDVGGSLHWGVPPTPGAPVPPGYTVYERTGNLLMLFPQMTTTDPNPPVSPAAYNLSDDVDDVTALPYENMEVEFDDSGWTTAVYVNGGTGFTFTPDPPTPAKGEPGDPWYVPAGGWDQNLWATGTKGYGACGWVGEPKGFSRFIDVPDAASLSAGASKAEVALRYGEQSIIRGKCDVLSSSAYHAGTVVLVTNHPIGFDHAPMLVQRVTNTYVSGTGLLRSSLEFGTAPLGSLGLRRQAATRPQARTPAVAQSVTPNSGLPLVNDTVTFHTQLIDKAGQPWRLAGAFVQWKVEEYDAMGKASSVGGYTISPGSALTYTDASGGSNIQITFHARGMRYKVTATTPD